MGVRDIYVASACARLPSNHFVSFLQHIASSVRHLLVTGKTCPPFCPPPPYLKVSDLEKSTAFWGVVSTFPEFENFARLLLNNLFEATGVD